MTFQKSDIVVLVHPPGGECSWSIGQVLQVNYVDGCCLSVTDFDVTHTLNQDRFVSLVEFLTKADPELGQFIAEITREKSLDNFFVDYTHHTWTPVYDGEIMSAVEITTPGADEVSIVCYSYFDVYDNRIIVFGENYDYEGDLIGKGLFVLDNKYIETTKD